MMAKDAHKKKWLPSFRVMVGRETYGSHRTQDLGAVMKAWKFLMIGKKKKKTAFFSFQFRNK